MTKILVSEDGEDTSLFSLVCITFLVGCVGLLSFMFALAYIGMLINTLEIFKLIVMTVVLVILVFVNMFIYKIWRFYYIYVLKRYKKVVENERETKTIKR